MRLTWVKFRAIERFDNNTTGNEASAEIHGTIEFNPEDQMIYIGTRCFPTAHVQAMIRVADVECPTCHERFSNNTAVAAHARFVHGILGRKAAKAAQEKNNV